MSQELHQIDKFKLPARNFRGQYAPEVIAQRAEQLRAESYPELVAVSTPDEDGKHELIDGVLNWLAMQLLGVQVVRSRFVTVAPEDVFYERLNQNRNQVFTYEMAAFILPELDAYYDRHFNGDGILKRGKCVQMELRTLGLKMGVNNVARFREMVNSPHRHLLMQKLDSSVRMFEDAYNWFQELQKPQTNNTADEDDSNDQESPNQTEDSPRSCNPVAAGKLVPVRVIVNGQGYKCNAGDFCGECKLHEFVMRAQNPLPPIEGGTE